MQINFFCLNPKIITQNIIKDCDISIKPNSPLMTGKGKKLIKLIKRQKIINLVQFLEFILLINLVKISLAYYFMITDIKYIKIKYIFYETNNKFIKDNSKKDIPFQP